jgi:hypothetical protein
MARLNTKLEAIGAEFLILGTMLVEGIVCHKTYMNVPGYDLIASNPEQNTSARVQVKSRWATDFDGGFLINNFDCDFVVFVQLNRGYRHHRANRGLIDGKRPPKIYVFPAKLVESSLYAKSSWGKAFLRDIQHAEAYVDNWHLIRNFLGKTTK